MIKRLTIQAVIAAVFALAAFYGYAQSAHAAGKVEIFVTSWCPYCKALEGFLKSRQIRYTRFDIEKSSEGKRLHEAMGGGGVPVTRINGRVIIKGFDPDALDQALGTGAHHSAVTSS